MPYQIIRIEIDSLDRIIAVTRKQPLFELEQDALALAEFDASRTGDDYGYDEEQNCWWAIDGSGRRVRFEIERLDNRCWPKHVSGGPA
jgi:hypothetical protein